MIDQLQQTKENPVDLTVIREQPETLGFQA